MDRSPNAIFYEVQNLREQRLMVLIVPAGLFLIGFFVYTMVQQLILGNPVGDKPMSDLFLLISGILYIFLGAFFLWVYFYSRLIIEVRPDGVYVRFHPFHRSFRHIPPASLEKYEVLTYRPIRDFGGFGIRMGPKGRAYNVSGNRGVYLTLKNGRRLLIGSQEAESMVDAIASIV